MSTRPSLDEVLHRTRDGQLGQAELVGDAAHGGSAADGHERRPRRLVDVTSVWGASLRRVTQASIDGTTASMARHSSSRASACGEEDLDVGRRGRVVVGGLGVEGEGALLEAEQLEQRVDRLGGVGRVGRLDADDLTAAAQTLPVPRPPVMRRRPVFFVAARRRSTSGRANVSRVPCRATATSGDEWAVVPIGTSGRGLQWILDARSGTTRVAQRGHGGGAHGLDGRFLAGPEPEGVGGLVDQHPEAVDAPERPAPGRPPGAG